LHLTADQVAAAEMCGVAFHPATEAQVARLTVQRRVFRIDGRPVLATRDGAFHETAGTLGPIVAEGLRRLADLAAWQGGASPPEDGRPREGPEPPDGTRTSAAPAPTPAGAPEQAVRVEAAGEPWSNSPAGTGDTRPARQGGQWPTAGTAREAERAEETEGAKEALKEALLAEFRGKAAELGVSLEALMSGPPRGAAGQGRKARRGAGVESAPKYRDPETGATWTGRGREPGWLKGKNRADFAVEG
jgi:DNA-binding protein H-NS